MIIREEMFLYLWEGFINIQLHYVQEFVKKYGSVVLGFVLCVFKSMELLSFDIHSVTGAVSIVLPHNL